MTTTLSVPEISCGHCKATIEAAVGPLDGVERVEVDVETRMVVVDGGDLAAVVDAIEAVGFDVER
ncbi:MAG: heavy-metal-associated domain-containing protein [Ilumatobacter sp.]